MKVGLVGFGCAGKSSVFAALTSMTGAAGKPVLASVAVPDERVDRLSAMWSPRKTTYGEITFQDYPSGAFGSTPGTLPAPMLGEMRTLDVLAEVVGSYSTGDFEQQVSLARMFHEELLLADLSIVEKRLDRLTREAGSSGERELLERCRDALEADRELRTLGLGPGALELLSGFQFLTLKPRVVVFNVGESAAAADDRPFREALRDWGVEVMVLSAPLERELAEIEAAEREEFLASYGLREGARDRFITSCYRLLDLITFLTAGEDEVRAWPIRRGSTAVEAAGKVHSDIARGFIRAEVIAYEDYIALGGETECRKAGKVKMQGRDYVMQDGDVVHFRFNV